MNCSDRSAPPATMQQTIEELLETIRTRFYPAATAVDRTAARRFHRDRRLLLYALTWPAAWLDVPNVSVKPGAFGVSLIASRGVVAMVSSATSR